MPKRLAERLIVQAEQAINRLDITGFIVDAEHRTITLQLQGSAEAFAGDPDRRRIAVLDKRLDEAASKDVMAQATRILVAQVLKTCGASQQQADAIDAAIVNNPELAWQACYGSLRDALYTKV